MSGKDGGRSHLATKHPRTSSYPRTRLCTTAEAQSPATSSCAAAVDTPLGPCTHIRRTARRTSRRTDRMLSSACTPRKRHARRLRCRHAEARKSCSVCARRTSRMRRPALARTSRTTPRRTGRNGGARTRTGCRLPRIARIPERNHTSNRCTTFGGTQNSPGPLPPAPGGMHSNAPRRAVHTLRRRQGPRLRPDRRCRTDGAHSL